jgi:hypothetical protein
MNPISSSAAAPDAAATTQAAAGDPAASTASTQAAFDQALNQVISNLGTSILSVTLDDLIQISQEDI